MSSKEFSTFWSNLETEFFIPLKAEGKSVRRKGLETVLAEVEALKGLSVAVAGDGGGTSPLPRGEGAEGDRKKMEEGDPGLDSDDDGEEDGDEKGCLPPTFLETIKPLITTGLSDPVEKCRELSAQTLTSAFALYPSEILAFLPTLVPVLEGRLAQPELIESSEEVRLLLTELMGVCVKGKILSPFVDDWIKILGVLLTDPYHEVRIKACSVIAATAASIPEVFHYNSSRLNSPLLCCLVHQQQKVRVSAVLCIRDVLLFGSPKSAEDFIPPLTAKMLDPHWRVRLAVTQTIGTWLLEFIDRYSHHAKMLPVMMSGLSDDCTEVKEEADLLWDKIGTKYLQENEADNKDRIDFPTDKKEGYPADVKRPNLGCRLLVQKEVGKLIPGITNEITSWTEGTRVKCAQLLYHLLLHAEDFCTMHSEQVINCLTKAVGDDNPIVKRFVLMTASILGVFSPFSVYWPLLESRLATSPNAALHLVAAILKSASPKVLRSDGNGLKVLETLSQTDICCTHTPSRHSPLLTCCYGVIKGDIPLGEGEEEELLFRILLSVLAYSKDEGIKECAEGGLSTITKSKYAPQILQELCSEADLNWGPESREALIFSTLLKSYPDFHQDDKSLDLALKILVKQLDPSKEPETRLNLFTLLSGIVEDAGERVGKKGLLPFISTIVEDVLGPSLVWKAGRKAAALRTAALSTLLSVLDGGLFEWEASLGERIIGGTLSLLEDSEYLTRLLSVQVLGRTAASARPHLPTHTVNKVYPELLRRLDDEKDEVRVSAGIALGRVFSSVDPKDFGPSSQRAGLDFAAEALFLHLDDEEERVQGAVGEALKAISVLDSGLILEKSEVWKGKHRSPEMCSALIDEVKTISIN